MRPASLSVELLLACIAILGAGLSACSSAESAADADAGAGMVLPSNLLHAPLEDTTGRTLVIADELARGKTVALVFWQAWCASCRAEAPELVAASRAHPDLQIVGVVSGPDDAVDAEELERTIRELGLPYRSVRDRTLDLTRALEIRGTPTIVVLDAHGEVLYHGHKVPQWERLL